MDSGLDKWAGRGGRFYADLASVEDVGDEFCDDSNSDIFHAELFTERRLHGKANITFNELLVGERRRTGGGEGGGEERGGKGREEGREGGGEERGGEGEET